VLDLSNRSLKYLFPIEPTGRAVAASGDGVMLTLLSQFQAQDWKKWLSRIRFAVRDRQSKIKSNRYKVLPSHSIFKPRVRIGIYADFAFAVLGPGLGKVAIPDQIRCPGQTFYYLVEYAFFTLLKKTSLS
jgi:hypothetical protein